MMPDLGKYAGAVLTAYGAGLLPLVAIVALSLLRSVRVRRKLAAAEERRGDG